MAEATGDRSRERAERSGGADVVTSPDPTLAVWRALDAEHTRNDDLRVAESIRTRESITAVGELLAQAHASERRRTDDLRKADSDRVDEHIRERVLDLRREIVLRAEHSKELAAAVAASAFAEKGRIDAIVTALREAAIASNKEASDRATALAAQVVATAEAARVAVAQTTTQLDAKISAQTTQFTERFGTIERSINLGEGRQLGPDPALALIATAMEKMQMQIIDTKNAVSEAKGTAQVTNPLLTSIIVGVIAIAGALLGHFLFK